VRRQSSAASRNDRHLRYPPGTRASNQRLVDGWALELKWDGMRAQLAASLPRGQG
jgi:hypothetical protein